MILSVGTDLAEVDRIRQAWERFGDRFLERVYTPIESQYSMRKANRFERLAARFAAKEAAMKALGTGLRGGVRWHDFEVRNAPSGKPALHLSGRAAEYAARMGVRHMHLSMTHVAAMAMAVVIFED